MFRIVFAALFGLLTVAITAPAHARDDGWSVVADSQASRLQDRIVIPVGRKAGRLEKIRLRAVNQRVSIHAVDILFGNGRRQRVSGFVRLRAGDATTNIDLAGDQRFIDEVIVSIRPSFSRRPVRLELIGQRRLEQYQVIASERVSSRTQSIILPVGQKATKFTRIRVAVRGRPIYVRRIVVTFGNGERQLISVYENIARGSTTADFDLKGERRNIRQAKVVMARPNGSAQIQLEALPAIGNQETGTRELVDLGTRKVDRKTETDTLLVGRRKGRFDALAFKARHSEIRLAEFTVVFGNGQQRRVRVNRKLHPGKLTSFFDFGGGRFIERIAFKYRSVGNYSRTGRLSVFGRVALKQAPRRARAERRGDWQLLGAQTASLFTKDTDVFHVGKDMGRFRAVRVRAMNQDIRIYGMKIFYGNGSSETVPIRGTLREGDTSPSIDLKGRHRFIDRIQFRYRTKLNFEGIARAEVWGLK